MLRTEDQIIDFAAKHGMVLENHWIAVGDVGPLSVMIDMIDRVPEHMQGRARATALGEIALSHFLNLYTNPEAKEP